MPFIIINEDTIPLNVKGKSKAVRQRWIKVWNSAFTGSLAIPGCKIEAAKQYAAQIANGDMLDTEKRQKETENAIHHSA